jgi:hypothetical protein
MPVQKLSRWTTIGLRQVDRKSREQLTSACKILDMAELTNSDFAQMWDEHPPWELDMEAARKFWISARHEISELSTKLYEHNSNIYHLLREQPDFEEIALETLRSNHFVLSDAVEQMFARGKEIEFERLCLGIEDCLKLHCPTLWNAIEEEPDSNKEIFKALCAKTMIETGDSSPTPQVLVDNLIKFFNYEFENGETTQG